MRDGLLPTAGVVAVGIFLCRTVVIMVGVGRESLVGVASESRFSWELGGSITSLEGTGVESLVDGFALGRELALVVSFRQEEG